MNHRPATRSTSLRDVLPPAPRPMLRLEGRARARMLAGYVAIHAVIFAGLAYTASWSPGLMLGTLVLCYVLENVLFVLGHIGLHVSFIETPEPQMTTITHHSFIHHYRDIRAYHKTWLSSRMSYFICARNGLKTLTSYIYLAAPILSAGIISLVDWRVGLCALSGLWGAHALQSICHEWYHHSEREGFYRWPTRLLLSGLERVGIMSTRRHIDHHRHHLHSLDEVHTWTDLYLPGAERLGEAMWAWVIGKHVPGERNMIEAMLRFSMAYYTIHFVLFTAAFLAAALWLA